MTAGIPGDEIITLLLTPKQHSGEVRFRLQATFLKWAVANRILKIIREQQERKQQGDKT